MQLTLLLLLVLLRRRRQVSVLSALLWSRVTQLPGFVTNGDHVRCVPRPPPA